MALNTWIGGATAVAQVKTFTITGASSGMTATWTLTVTSLNDGTTTTVTYQEDGSPSVAEIATGLYAAWQADTHGLTARITATNPSSGVMVLTADTAGEPFSVALADDGDGTHTEADTTASSGPYDYRCPANWSLGAVPAAGDDIQFTGSSSILYGLDNDGVELDSVVRLATHTGDIGTAAFPLLLDMGDGEILEINGTTGQIWLSVSSAAVSPVVNSTEAPTATGEAGLYLTGTAFVDLNIYGNSNVRLVAATVTGDINQIGSGSVLDVPAGNTLTGVDLDQAGGRSTIGVAIGTIEVKGALCTTTGSGAVTTMTAVNGGQITSNSTGTVGTASAQGQNSLIDFTASLDARTVTNSSVQPGGKLRFGAHVTKTNPTSGLQEVVGI